VSSRAKCTKTVREAVRAALEAGHTRAEAANIAGIAFSTFAAWRKAGEAPGAKLCHRRFVEAIEAGESAGARKALRVMDDLMAEGSEDSRFKAARFMLTSRWGRKEGQAIEVSGPDAGPVRVEVSPLAALAAVAGAAAEPEWQDEDEGADDDPA
jgi:hypothetical protein